MADRHEEDLAEWFGGIKSRGSGNQAHAQMDGRHDHRRQAHAFAWDAKSTRGESISVSRKMWDKAIEQSHGETPMIPLRFYDTDHLDVGLDLVAVDVQEFRSMLEDLAVFAALRDELRQIGDHTHPILDETMYEEDGGERYRIIAFVRRLADKGLL